MPTVFVSYRRTDTAAVVYRLAERLRQTFGPDGVYVDVDSIPAGRDFRDHIRAAVARCDAALVVIGPDWAGTTEGGRRLDDPADFVRQEVEEVLARGIPVVPVLVGRTPPPRTADLPEAVRGIAFRQAEPLDPGVDFHPHADRLCRKLLGDAPVTSPPNRWLVPALLGASAVAAAAVAVVLLNRPKPDPAPPNISTTGAGSPAVVGNNNNTVVNPPDKETPKAVRELTDLQQRQAAKAEAQREKDEAEKKAEADAKETKRLKDEAEKRTIAENKEKQRQEEIARKKKVAEEEADRRFRAAIQEDVEAIRAVAKLNARDPAQLADLAKRMDSIGSARGAARAYAGYALAMLGQGKKAEAKAAFQNAAAQYQAIDDRNMTRWVGEQLTDLTKE